MNPEAARALIEEERTLSPRVVDLARYLSLAVRIETELLRAMRLRIMGSVEAGVEADLYFSSLIQTRDVNAFSLIPEVREYLHKELAQHKDALEMARKVTEAAHREMDAVILLEELVVYHALRDDHNAYNDMQIQLGRIIRELNLAEADPDLVYWAASAYPRLPERAKNSQAGRLLTGLLDSNLIRISGTGLKTGEVNQYDSQHLSQISIGFQAMSNSVQLRYPHAPGWIKVKLSGGEPASIEVAWPFSGGWQSRMVELYRDAPFTEIDDVPLGLIRLRSISGDESKLRVNGPFSKLQPKLLTLYRGAKAELPQIVEDELQDLEWYQHWLPLRDQVEPIVFICSSLRGNEKSALVEELIREFRTTGIETWSDEENFQVSGEWNSEHSKIISSCESAVIVLSQEALESEYFRYEISALAFRQAADPEFVLHLLVTEDVTNEMAGKILAELGVPEIGKLVWGREPETVVQAIRQQIPSMTIPLEDIGACLLSFPDLDSQSEYLKGITTGSTAIMEPLMEVIEQQRPVLMRAGDQIQRLGYELHFELAITGSEQVNRFHYQQAALDAFQQIDRDSEASTGETSDQRQILRQVLLEAEQNLISDWLELISSEDLSRKPSRPAHAMVLIKWERWFSKQDNKPREFSSYESAQKRLSSLLSDSGTLWVVTSRTVSGKRVYQLAYCIENVEITEDIDSDGKPLFHAQAGSADDVIQFPLHDATQLLLDLNFTTGEKMSKSGDIGRRLQSIPHLSVSDVELLQAFAANFDESSNHEDIQLRLRITGDSEGGHQGTVRSIAVNTDGSIALTAGNSNPDQTIKQWDLETGNLVRSYEQLAAAGCWTPMAIASDASFALTGYEGELNIIDLKSGQLSTVQISAEPLTAVAFNGEDRFLVGTGSGSISLVNRSGVVRNLILSREEVLRLTVMGDIAVILQASSIEVIDLNEFKPIHQLDVETGEAGLHFQRPPLTINEHTNEVLFGVPLRAVNLQTGDIRALPDIEQSVVEANASRLVLFGSETTFSILDTLTVRPLGNFSIEPEQPSCLAMSGDARRILIGDYEHNLYLYELPPLNERAGTAVNPLIQILQDENEDSKTRYTAIAAIGRIRPEAEIVIESLIRAIKDKDQQIQSFAGQTLLGLEIRGKVNLVEPLLRMLEDKENARVRFYGAAAIGRIGPEAGAAVEPLIRALRDKDQKVRRITTEALYTIGPSSKSALGPLIEVLKDQSNNEWVRSNAALALVKIGPEEEGVIEALTEALNDNSEKVRNAAGQALKQ